MDRISWKRQNSLEKVKGAGHLFPLDAGPGRRDRSWVPGTVQTWPGSLTDPRSYTLDPREEQQESVSSEGLV